VLHKLLEEMLTGETPEEEQAHRPPWSACRRTCGHAWRVRHGRAEAIVDWKSDVVPSASTIASYLAQLGDYLDATGAATGLLVFLIAARVEQVGAMAETTGGGVTHVVLDVA
jgi:hypothetical protein